MLDQVQATILRHRMIPVDARTAVAVSGGPDSVCLLHVLRELRVPLAGVAHVDHQLRGEESRQDHEFVKNLAQSFELPLFAAVLPVAETVGNLEQAARQARREFFRSLLREGCATHVALGHTRDDQAETVLFRLLRGSGISGLAGVLPVTRDGIVRPLLDVTRAQVLTFLGTRGIAWQEDSSNRDPRFARNRIRHQLLPELTREWNPHLAENLAHLADLAYEEELEWTREMTRLAPVIFNREWDKNVGRTPWSARDALIPPKPTRGSAADQGVRPTFLSHSIELDIAKLAAYSTARARRILRAAVAAAKGDLRRIEYDHVERILDLARRPAGSGCVVLPGITVTRSFDVLRFSAEAGGTRGTILVQVPGVYQAPSGNSLIHLEFSDQLETPEACATLKMDLCWRRLPAQFELRGWRPGDHYQPVGQASDHTARDEKIKDMFQRARVPSWERPGWPILSTRGEILWARQFGAAAQYAASSDSPRRVRVRELPLL